MEIVIRALVIFVFVWLITRASGRATLGELSAFELLLYVTMGDLVQQAVTQQDYSVTGAMLAVATFALLTIGLSWAQWRVPRVRPAVTGRPLLVFEHGRPVDATLHTQRMSLADLLVAAREQGITRTSEIEYAVLEADGKVSFFTRDSDEGGASEKPDAG